MNAQMQVIGSLVVGLLIGFIIMFLLYLHGCRVIANVQSVNCEVLCRNCIVCQSYQETGMDTFPCHCYKQNTEICPHTCQHDNFFIHNLCSPPMSTRKKPNTFLFHSIQQEELQLVNSIQVTCIATNMHIQL